VSQCVAVCCRVLCCVAVCYSVLHRVASCCSVLQCVVRTRVDLHVAVSCTVLRGHGVLEAQIQIRLQHTATHCNTLQHTATDLEHALDFIEART